MCVKMIGKLLLIAALAAAASYGVSAEPVCCQWCESPPSPPPPPPPPPPPSPEAPLSPNAQLECPDKPGSYWAFSCKAGPDALPFYIDTSNITSSYVNVIRKSECKKNCDVAVDHLYVHVNSNCYNKGVGPFIVKVNNKLHYAVKYKKNIIKWSNLNIKKNTTINFVKNGYCGDIIDYCSDPNACPTAVVDKACDNCPTVCVAW